jgi:hypothetical protein
VPGMAKLPLPSKSLLQQAVMVALVLAAFRFLLTHFGGPLAKYAGYV